MADRKITALTELTAPVATDVFPIIDVSESANANKNKKIQLTTILRGIPNGSASAPSVGFIDDTGTTGLFRVTDDEIGISCNQTQIASFATTGLKLGTGTAAAQLHLFSSDTTDQVIIENTDTGADTAPDLVLFRNSASPADNDNLANLVFRGQDDNGDAVEYATIAAQIADASNGSEDGILDLMSTAAGTLASRIRLKSEFVGIHESDPTFPLHLATADTTAGFCIESNLNSSGSSADILLFHRRGDSGAGQDNDVLSTITFQGKNDGANETDTVPAGVEYAAIEAVIVDASDDTEDGKLNLEVMVAGTLTSVLAIDSNGATIVGNIVVSGTVDGVDIAARDTLFGGLTSSSGVLTNGVTATTQSASDNSTKVATTAYTDTAISNLIDSSPSTLNTLNELAAALGDDANFSTTVTNSIATKLPLAGGTLTGNVNHNDNVKAIFGTGGDLEIYHDSNNSVIDSNTGDFYILSAGAFIFQTNNNENAIKCVANGAVELYFDNVKKAETTSTGIDVDGSVTADDIITAGALLHEGDTDTLVHFSAADTIELKTGGISRLLVNNFAIQLGRDILTNGQRILLGDSSGSSDDRLCLGESQDLQIFHDGSDSKITNKTGNLLIEAKDSETGIKVIPDGSVELYHDNVKRFNTTADAVDVHGHLNLGANTDDKRLRFGINNDLQLYHDATDSHILNSTGILKINSTSGVAITGGLLFGSDTADANKLEDYEEGTWTPNFAGLTASNTTNNCFYIKIGDMVTAWFRATMPTSSSTANATIAGLPFNIFAANNVGIAGGAFSETNAGSDLSMIGNANTDNMFILECNSSGVAVKTLAQISGKDFRGSITYRVA